MDILQGVWQIEIKMIKKYRTILLAQANSEKENIASLLAGTEQQVALSDEQLRTVEKHLLVKSLEEYDAKFGEAQREIELADKEDVFGKPQGDVAEFANRLEAYGGEQYEIWYQRETDAAWGETVNQVGNKAWQKQQEIRCGVEAFFYQGQMAEPEIEVELLVLNITSQELLQPTQLAKLELYLATANHKRDEEQRIHYAILPEVEYIQKKSFVRERFLGNGGMQEMADLEAKQPECVSTELVLHLLAILGRHKVTLCYQYETGLESSAEAFAREGMEPYRQAGKPYEGHQYAEYITCCYPNLTAPREGLYIGAAYVVAAMLSTQANEGGRTRFLKELYPYSEQTRADIATKRYGCLLASETAGKGWAALPYMIMLSEMETEIEK